MNGDGEANSGKIVFKKNCKQISEQKCYFFAVFANFQKKSDSLSKMNQI
jgi:hypothetical protein